MGRIKNGDITFLCYENGKEHIFDLHSCASCKIHNSSTDIFLMPDISMCLKTTLVFELKTQLSIADANKFIIFTLTHHHFPSHMQ